MHSLCHYIWWNWNGSHEWFIERTFFMPQHNLQTVQKTYVFQTALLKSGQKWFIEWICMFFPETTFYKNKKWFKKMSFVPWHLALKKGSKSVSFLCHNNMQKKNSSKRVNFSCCNIWPKKWLKKHEFFMAHHFGIQKLFKNLQFFEPHIYFWSKNSKFLIFFTKVWHRKMYFCSNGPYKLWNDHS